MDNTKFSLDDKHLLYGGKPVARYEVNKGKVTAKIIDTDLNLPKLDAENRITIMLGKTKGIASEEFDGKVIETDESPDVATIDNSFKKRRKKRGFNF